MAAVTRELARYAVDSRFEDLPEGVRHEGERAFVNILGCYSVAQGTGDRPPSGGFRGVFRTSRGHADWPRATRRYPARDAGQCAFARGQRLQRHAFGDGSAPHGPGRGADPHLVRASTGDRVAVPPRTDPQNRNPAAGRQHPGDAAGKVPGRGFDAEHSRGDRRRGRLGQVRNKVPVMFQMR